MSRKRTKTDAIMVENQKVEGITVDTGTEKTLITPDKNGRWPAYSIDSKTGKVIVAGPIPPGALSESI